MKRVKLIGLTGQSGAGKSTVSRLFAENGFTVIDADKMVKRVYEKDAVCLRAVASEFGEDIIAPDGSLNRPLLAQRAFADPQQTKLLGAIVHPFVLSESFKELRSAQGAAVFDAPQLFESNADVLCDVIVSVVADEKLRLRRVMARDNIGQAQARQRLDAQLDERFFREHSDYIIENNGDLQLLTQQARQLIEKLKTEVT